MASEVGKWLLRPGLLPYQQRGLGKAPVGEQLRRLYKGRTQKSVAAELGVSTRTLQRWADKTRSPGPAHRQALDVMLVERFGDKAKIKAAAEKGVEIRITVEISNAPPKDLIVPQKYIDGPTWAGLMARGDTDAAQRAAVGFAQKYIAYVNGPTSEWNTGSATVELDESSVTVLGWN